MKRNVLCSLVLVALLLSVFTPLHTVMAETPAPANISGMLGQNPPTGTKVTSSGDYNGRPASRAIDGDVTTEWTGTAYNGYVQLEFPEPVTLDYVQIISGSVKKAVTKYTIEGLVNGSWTSISDPYTMTVPSAQTMSDPIRVKHNTYSGIKVNITMDTSWVGITEITIGNYQNIHLTATGGDKQVILNWNQIANADSYTVKYGTEAGKYTETLTATKDSYGNYVIPKLSNGTQYYFVVSANVNGVETVYSNEASATPNAIPVIEPDPDQTSGNRAILVVTMTNGLEKEFDLSAKEVSSFIEWYNQRQEGIGKASYAINKHDNNKGPFTSRKDYVIYDKILTFEVSEYN